VTYSIALSAVDMTDTERARGVTRDEPDGTELPVLQQIEGRMRDNLKRGIRGQHSKNGYFSKYFRHIPFTPF
jgi:hypothetical protein